MQTERTVVKFLQPASNINLICCLLKILVNVARHHNTCFLLVYIMLMLSLSCNECCSAAGMSDIADVS